MLLDAAAVRESLGEGFGNLPKKSRKEKEVGGWAQNWGRRPKGKGAKGEGDRDALFEGEQEGAGMAHEHERASRKDPSRTFS